MCFSNFDEINQTNYSKIESTKETGEIHDA